MKTHLCKYIENFTTKNGKFSVKKKSDIFHISAQNIDCVVLVRTASVRQLYTMEFACFSASFSIYSRTSVARKSLGNMFETWVGRATEG